MGSVIFLLFSIRLHVPEIRGFEFKNCYIVFITPSSPAQRVDLKRGFARWEEDKGYVWVQESLPSDRFLVDKKEGKIIFVDDITNCREIHGWKLKILDVFTTDILNYCIETEIENPEILKGDKNVVYMDGRPTPRHYRIRNDTIFFYLKWRDKFLKHKEFRIYKEGKHFKSIDGNILYLDIKSMKFGGIDTLNEEFKWENHANISITVNDSVTFMEKLFIFDKVKRVLNKETVALCLRKFTANSKIRYPNMSIDSVVQYYMEFKKWEFLKEKKIAISYPMAIHNDSVYSPVERYYEFIKDESNKFIDLVMKFKRIGKIDTLSKSFLGFDLKEDRITTGVHLILRKDKFRILIDLADTSEYEKFYENINSKIEKAYKLLELCMKNDKFKEEVKKSSKSRGFPEYCIYLHQKDGKFPPYLKNGEPMIGLLIIRRPPLPSQRPKFSTEKERKKYLEKLRRARKYVIYHLDEKGRLVRWERKSW